MNDRCKNFLNRGKQAVDSSRLELALFMFKEALKADKTSFDARKNIRAIQIALSKQRNESSFSLKLKKLCKIFSLMKASKLISKGKGIEAMDVLEDLLDGNPFDCEYIEKMVEAAEVAKMLEVAAMTIEAVCASGVKDKNLLEKAATYYTLAKDYCKATETYKTILDTWPNDQRIVQLLKNAEAKKTMASGWDQNVGIQGGTRNLLANQKQAEQLDKKNKANLAPDDIDATAAEYIARILTNPNDINASRALARTYLKGKRFDDAIKVLEQTTSKTADPELDKMLSNAKLSKYDYELGFLDANSSKYAELKSQRDQFELDDLTARVERYPNDLHLRFELGSLYAKYEYYDEAIKHLQLAQKSPKDRLEALYLLAKCFIAKGQKDLGTMQLETAASAIPTMTDLKKKIVYELARCAEEDGNKEKAYSLYKDIYSNDVTFLDVEKRMMAMKAN